MDEREKSRDLLKLKIFIIIPVIIILVFLCWPRESGDSEAALKRNIARERLTNIFDIEIHHVQDFVLEDAGEIMRGVVFSDESDDSSPYFLHWYQKQEDGTFKLYWGEEGTSAGKMCDGVYIFSALYINGNENSYDLYYVDDPAVKEFVIRFEYHLEKEKDQVEYGSVQVDSAPELICIPQFYEHDFAPAELKSDDAKSRSCGTSISAFDENGMLISGSMAKNNDLTLHKVYTIKKY